MSTNVPTTIYRPTDGNGEVGQSDSSLIDTEAGLDITTEAGVSLIIEDGSFTQVPASVWSEDDSQ